MGIDFTEERWKKVKDAYRLWWNKDLERPIIPVEINGQDPGRNKPDAPLLGQENCHDFSIEPEKIIDRIDYELSKKKYLGDAFPYFWFDFGPGITAAFIGAKVNNTTGRVWLLPTEEKPITDLHFSFNPDNPWFRRLVDLYEAGTDRWQGQVLMGLTDLGGVLDILATFRPGEKLLMDFYDNPEEVKRLIWEIHEVWHECFKILSDTCGQSNPGYSDWSGIFSESPFYMLQCDFSYMIGPEMFDEFVKPELTASVEKLDHTFYHLDGPGEIPHLDPLVDIEKLDGIQWVPPADDFDAAHWPEVFKKIAGGGKLMQTYANFETLDAIVERLGSGKGLHRHYLNGPEITLSEYQIRKKLECYGVE